MMNIIRGIDQAVPGFPNAPEGWNRAVAMSAAQADGVDPVEDHWEAVRTLQEYFARHADDTSINIRELLDALEERFHSRGGMRYLYKLFPGGPVAQGCRMAGLEAPPGSTDQGFGSVQ
jgi:tRNA 2-thiouridine synthesizing protein E